MTQIQLSLVGVGGQMRGTWMERIILDSGKISGLGGKEVLIPRAPTWAFTLAETRG